MRCLVAILVLLWACQSSTETPSVAVAAQQTAPTPVVTGAANVVAGGFAQLRGKRVGLIVNHTARVGEAHLIDLMHNAPEVELVALFGPEHGLRGEADAGERVEDGRDDRTGVPIYSLYGRTRKPTPAMLANVDVLVFDIQDVGARFYTYIATMGLAMEAAAQQGIPFVVLDRPNPLGGTYVSGFMLEPAFSSFVGPYAIPIAHGLTVGELARMVQGERLHQGLDDLDLTVIPMTGWTRSMRWPDTGLPWIPTSPNIPDYETALIYPGTCFFEATTASEGRGTYTPFKVLGAPWADGPALAQQLNDTELDGLLFAPTAFTPESIQGMAAQPKLLGETVQGVVTTITAQASVKPVEAGIYLLHAFYHAAPSSESFLKEDWLGKLAGTGRLYEMLRSGASPERIMEAWSDEVAAFMEQREPYLLYDSVLPSQNVR